MITARGWGRPRGCRWIAVLVYAFVLQLCAAPARAADPSDADIQEARAAFKRAERAEREERWADALAELERAAAVKVTAGIAFHIAYCQEHLGQDAAALHGYRRARDLAEAMGAHEVLDLVAEPLRRLEKSVPRLRVVRVTPRARVAIDGRAVEDGRTVDRRLDVGTHTIHAEREGYEPLDTRISLRPDDSETIQIELAQSSAASGAATEASAPVAPERAPPRTLAIVLSASAVALAAAGVGAYFVADGLANDARDACASSATAAACVDAPGPIRTWDAVALGSWIAAAGATAGAIWAWTRPAVTAPRARSTAIVGVGPTGVMVRGTFE